MWRECIIVDEDKFGFGGVWREGREGVEGEGEVEDVDEEEP